MGEPVKWQSYNDRGNGIYLVFSDRKSFDDRDTVVTKAKLERLEWFGKELFDSTCCWGYYDSSSNKCPADSLAARYPDIAPCLECQAAIWLKRELEKEKVQLLEYEIRPAKTSLSATMVAKTHPDNIIDACDPITVAKCGHAVAVGRQCACTLPAVVSSHTPDEQKPRTTLRDVCRYYLARPVEIPVGYPPKMKDLSRIEIPVSAWPKAEKKRFFDRSMNTDGGWSKHTNQHELEFLRLRSAVKEQLRSRIMTSSARWPQCTQTDKPVDLRVTWDGRIGHARFVCVDCEGRVKV